MAPRQISKETLDAVADDATIVATETGREALSVSEDVAARVLAEVAEAPEFVAATTEEILDEIADFDLD